METFERIVTIASGLTVIIGLLVLFNKQGKDIYNKISTKQDEEESQKNDLAEIKEMTGRICKKIDVLEDVERQHCRNTVKNIYYKYCNEKKIPLFELKTVNKIYELYHDKEKLNGNSYLDLLYNQIQSWEVDTITYKDFEDDEDNPKNT